MSPSNALKKRAPAGRVPATPGSQPPKGQGEPAETILFPGVTEDRPMQRSGDGPHAQVYQKPKSAMQSASMSQRNWIMEFAADKPVDIDPLMGWTGSRSQMTQVKLTFPTLTAAKAFATVHGVRCDFDEHRTQPNLTTTPRPKRSVGLTTIKIRDCSPAVSPPETASTPVKAA